MEQIVINMTLVIGIVGIFFNPDTPLKTCVIIETAKAKIPTIPITSVMFITICSI